MKFSAASLCASLAAAFALSGGVVHAQTPAPLYADSTGANIVQTGSEHFLQQITLAPGPTPFILTGFTISLNVQATSTMDTTLVVQFYTGLDTSDTSTNVLANATYVAGSQGSINTAQTGNFSFGFSPLSINLGSNPNLGVEIFLFTDPNYTNYATGIVNGRFATVAPTTGSSLGYVWNDADLSDTFSGAEKTTFGQSQANIRMTLTGVPEPGTYALCGLGALAFGGLALRQRRAARA